MQFISWMLSKSIGKSLSDCCREKSDLLLHVSGRLQTVHRDATATSRAGPRQHVPHPAQVAHVEQRLGGQHEARAQSLNGLNARSAPPRGRPLVAIRARAVLDFGIEN